MREKVMMVSDDEVLGRILGRGLPGVEIQLVSMRHPSPSSALHQADTVIVDCGDMIRASRLVSVLQKQHLLGKTIFLRPSTALQDQLSGMMVKGVYDDDITEISHLCRSVWRLVHHKTYDYTQQRMFNDEARWETC